MLIGRRYLVRQASGHLTELPEQEFDRADDGVAPIASLAGRCVEMVAVLLIEDRRRIPRVYDLAFTKVYFDDRGYVDVSKRDLMVRLMLASCIDQRPTVERELATLSGKVPRLPNLNGEQRTSFANQARGRLAQEFAWRPDPTVLSQLLDRIGLPVSEPLGRRLRELRTLH
jgi:hypothetical protein